MGERITSELIHKKLEFTSTWDDWEPIEMAWAMQWRLRSMLVWRNEKIIEMIRS